jgi:hypothetical protein
MWLFMALVVVIFGVDFTDPHIVGVILEEKSIGD